MGHSSVEFGNKMFWAKDALIEGWLHFLSDSNDIEENSSDWLVHARNFWRSQNEECGTGLIFCKLDEFLSDEKRTQIVLELSKKVLSELHIKCKNGKVPKTDYMGEPISEPSIIYYWRGVEGVGIFFTRLLDGTLEYLDPHDPPYAWRCSRICFKGKAYWCCDHGLKEWLFLIKKKVKDEGNSKLCDLFKIWKYECEKEDGAAIDCKLDRYLLDEYKEGILIQHCKEVFDLLKSNNKSGVVLRKIDWQDQIINMPEKYWQSVRAVGSYFIQLLEGNLECYDANYPPFSWI